MPSQSPRFGGTNEVLGRPILLNGVPYTVVGILPRGFQPDPEADVWLPLQAEPNITNQGHYLNVAGRLKPGVTVAGAQAQMKIVGEQFRKANPKWMDAEEGVAVVPMRDATTGEVRTALLVLFGAVALVLLIACANVANLLLARAAGRQRELAIRSAVGANRGRVVRQLLTESVLLAGCGGMLGLGLGAAGVRGLLLLVPGNIPRVTDQTGTAVVIPALDWRVTAFTIGVSLLTGLLFGLFPALHTSKPDLVSTLKESSGRSGTSLRHTRVRSALVVAEMALALVLLVGAALLIRSFVGLRSVDPGFDPHNVFTFKTSLAGGELHHGERQRAYDAGGPTHGNVARRRGRCIDHRSAGRGRRRSPVHDRRQTARARRYGDEQWRSVSPHYFRVFQHPLVARARVHGDGYRRLRSGGHRQ